MNNNNIRGTPSTSRAGPLLGIITFLAMYLYLHRFGRFSRGTGETAT
ncbi:hypothetical protein [Arthrobacter sp. C152]